jgi:hypothetical protein
MLASLLTTLGFSLSVIFATRSAKVLGGPTANLARLALAAFLLAVWSHALEADSAGLDCRGFS